MSPRIVTLAKVVVVLCFLSIPLWLLLLGRYDQHTRLESGERMLWYHVVVAVSDVDMHEGQISDEWLVSGPFDTESSCDAELKRDTKRTADPKPGETGDECLQHFTADAAALPPYSGERATAAPGGTGF
ncbi:MAG: hypothetical protein WAJ85_10050 [Candidatus Baltobacteraceae bacterium]|jgi:hypothetical protein